jgi:hypothetical protein
MKIPIPDVWLVRGNHAPAAFYPRSLFVSSSANAAALILATWIAANPPAVVMQSRPGIDIHFGHNRLIALVPGNSGISPFDFGITAR